MGIEPKTFIAFSNLCFNVTMSFFCNLCKFDMFIKPPTESQFDRKTKLNRLRKKLHLDFWFWSLKVPEMNLRSNQLIQGKNYDLLKFQSLSNHLDCKYIYMLFSLDPIASIVSLSEYLARSSSVSISNSMS